MEGLISEMEPIRDGGDFMVKRIITTDTELKSVML